MVAKKDYGAPKHVELDVKNLFVIKACQSLNSRGCIKTQFSCKFYYYTLTDEGIEYLREWLNLPSEIVPVTFKKVQRAVLPDDLNRLQAPTVPREAMMAVIGKATAKRDRALIVHSDHDSPELIEVVMPLLLVAGDKSFL